MIILNYFIKKVIITVVVVIVNIIFQDLISMLPSTTKRCKRAKRCVFLCPHQKSLGNSCTLADQTLVRSAARATRPLNAASRRLWAAKQLTPFSPFYVLRCSPHRWPRSAIWLMDAAPIFQISSRAAGRDSSMTEMSQHAEFKRVEQLLLAGQGSS